MILLPALFAVLFLGMQAALYYHARTVAIAAAQEGARAAGAETGSESRGVDAANTHLARVEQIRAGSGRHGVLAGARGRRRDC